MKHIKYIIAAILVFVMTQSVLITNLAKVFAESEEVIIWTTDQTSADTAQVLKAELEEKFDVKLKFVYFSASDADTKINLGLASGEKWDMIMESNLGRYNEMVSKGLVRDITQSVKVDYPNIYENMPSYAQDDMTYIDGNIYGIPIVDFVNLPAIMVRKDILADPQIDMAYLIDENEGRITWEELELLMSRIVQARDIKIKDGRVTKTLERLYGATEGMTSHCTLFQAWSDAAWSIPWVSSGDEEIYSGHIATFPQAVVYIAVLRYWFQNGYLNPAYFSLSASDSLSQFVSGESPVRFASLTQDYIDPTVRERVAYLYPPTGEMGGGSGIMVNGFTRWVFNKQMSDSKYEKIMKMISYMATQEGYDRCNYGIEGTHYQLTDSNAVQYIGQQYWGLSFYRSIKLKRIDTYMQEIPNLERQINEFKNDEYPICTAGTLTSSRFYNKMLSSEYFKDRRDPAVNKYMLTEFAKFVTTDEPLENWQEVRLTYKGMIGDFGEENYRNAMDLGLAEESDDENVQKATFAHFNDLKSYATTDLGLFKEIMERVGQDYKKVLKSMSYEEQEDGTWVYTGPLKTVPHNIDIRDSLITLFTLIGVIIALFILALFLTRKTNKKNQE